MPVSSSISPAIIVVDRGEATGGSLTSLIDSKKNWPIDLFHGSAVNFIVGGVMVTRRISSNTATTLNFQTIGAAVVPGTRYFIVGSITIISGTDIDIAAQSVGNLGIDIKAATAKVGITINSADITGNIPIDIKAQTVGNIGVDIKAQTVGNIGIDIKAQTVGSINVNLAASAITLNINISSQSAFNMNINIAAAASAVTLNINIKSQTANLNVNIAASAITLNINISSQSANLNVNIAASAVTITVSVTGTANIQITAQTVGISVQGEWQVQQGNQKLLRGYSVNIPVGGNYDAVIYTVPAGKTLYIYGASFAIYANANADRDFNQTGYAILALGAVSYYDFGGNGGQTYSFSIPAKVIAGTTITYKIYNVANHACNIGAALIGYEV